MKRYLSIAVLTIGVIMCGAAVASEMKGWVEGADREVFYPELGTRIVPRGEIRFSIPDRIQSFLDKEVEWARRSPGSREIVLRKSGDGYVPLIDGSVGGRLNDREFEVRLLGESSEKITDGVYLTCFVFEFKETGAPTGTLRLRAHCTTAVVEEDEPITIGDIPYTPVRAYVSWFEPVVVRGKLLLLSPQNGGGLSESGGEESESP